MSRAIGSVWNDGGSPRPQEAGERTHGDRPRDSLLAHWPDFGQGLHGRAVEQPLLAIQSLGRELARAGMSQIEHRGSNRLGR